MKHRSMRRKTDNRRDHAVSEVLGTVILLGIAVTLFSIVYISVLSFPQTPSPPSANIAFSVDKPNLILSHLGGAPLEANTNVRILIYNDAHTLIHEESQTMGATWEAGDSPHVYDLGTWLTGLTGYSIDVMVIDPNSNSIVMQGTQDILANRPPVISVPNPYNGQSRVSIDLTRLNFSISDPDNDEFTWGINIDPDVLIDVGQYSDTNMYCIIDNLEEGEEYTWVVSADDSNWPPTTETYTFSTIMPIIYVFNDVDCNDCDMDPFPDKGTETGFENCQDTTNDGVDMVIQEDNYEIPAVIDEVLNVEGFNEGLCEWTKTGDSPYLDVDDDNYISTSTDDADVYWFSFEDTMETGDGFTIAMYVDFYNIHSGNKDDLYWFIDTNGDNNPEFNGIIVDPTTGVKNTGTIAGLDTASEINNARVWFRYHKHATQYEMTIDHAFLMINRPSSQSYQIDFEYEFQDVNYENVNRELWMYVSSVPVTEALNVYASIVTTWTLIGTITNVGWINLPAIGITDDTYNIRLAGSIEIGDTAQGEWAIDCIYLRTWDE